MKFKKNVIEISKFETEIFINALRNAIEFEPKFSCCIGYNLRSKMKMLERKLEEIN